MISEKTVTNVVYVADNGRDYKTREEAAAALADAAPAVRIKPLTVAVLADALDCFWNAAIGAAHQQQDGHVLASIMAEGIAAVATRLREHDTAPAPAAPALDARPISVTEATDEQLLLALVMRGTLKKSPRSRTTKDMELLVGIGKDHSVVIDFFEDDLDVLRQIGGSYED